MTRFKFRLQTPYDLASWREKMAKQDVKEKQMVYDREEECLNEKLAGMKSLIDMERSLQGKKRFHWQHGYVEGTAELIKSRGSNANRGSEKGVDGVGGITPRTERNQQGKEVHGKTERTPLCPILVRMAVAGAVSYR